MEKMFQMSEVFCVNFTANHRRTMKSTSFDEFFCSHINMNKCDKRDLNKVLGTRAATHFLGIKNNVCHFSYSWWTNFPSFIIIWIVLLILLSSTGWVITLHIRKTNILCWRTVFIYKICSIWLPLFRKTC